MTNREPWRVSTKNGLDSCLVGYMLNEQFTWLTPFIQLECPSFAWRTRDAESFFFFSPPRVLTGPGSRGSCDEAETSAQKGFLLRLCAFAPLRRNNLADYLSTSD